MAYHDTLWVLISRLHPNERRETLYHIIFIPTFIHGPFTKKTSEDYAPYPVENQRADDRWNKSSKDLILDRKQGHAGSPRIIQCTPFLEITICIKVSPVLHCSSQTCKVNKLLRQRNPWTTSIQVGSEAFYSSWMS
jgi:hypothetical protein